MTIPADEVRYCADRSAPGPGCNFRLFVLDKTQWNWTREAAYLGTVDEVKDWAKEHGLKPVYLG